RARDVSCRIVLIRARAPALLPPPSTVPVIGSAAKSLITIAGSSDGAGVRARSRRQAAFFMDGFSLKTEWHDNGRRATVGGGPMNRREFLSTTASIGVAAAARGQLAASQKLDIHTHYYTQGFFQKI